MAKYAKRADGRYSTSVTVGRKPDGSREIKILYGKTIKELDDKVADFKSKANKGIIIDDKQLTMETWALKWLELYKKNKTYNTYQMYENAVETHIIPTLGELRLGQMKKHQLQELLNKLIEQGKHRTAEIVKLSLKQIINAAIDEQYIYVDISHGLSLPKKPRNEKRALTDEEIKLLTDADLTLRERAYVECLLYCGLRRGEALGLSQNIINLNSGVIPVRNVVIFKKNNAEIKNIPKSDAGQRDVPIPDKLLTTLKMYMNECGSILFPMQTKEDFMTKSSFRKFWDGIIKKSGLPDDVTPHILRHTYATKLFYGGVDVKTAQKLLGHASIQMTLDIYTHLQNDTEKLKNQLNNIF